jgi:hypothetical protein
MIIREITMKGFKNHQKEVSYKLPFSATIYGDNDKGKTTIADAICWCLYVADYSGKEKITKALTNNYSKAVKVALVVDICTDGGKIATNEYKRIAGAGPDYDGFFINGNKVPSQSFANYIGMDKNVFFSMINPFYFSSLSKADAKDTILKVIKKVDDPTVLEKLDDYQKELLVNNGFKNGINAFMVKVKDNISTLQKDILYFQGTIDAKKDKIEIPEAKDITKAKQNAQDINAEIIKLNALIKEKYTQEFKQQKLKEEKQQELNNLKQQLAALSAQTNNDKIAKLEGEIEYYKKYPIPSKPQLQSVEVTKYEISKLRNQYVQIKKQIEQLCDMKIRCNKCGNITVVSNPERKALDQHILEVKSSGITMSANLKELENQNVQTQKHYQEEVAKVRGTIAAEIQKKEEEIKKIKSQKENPAVTEIKSKIVKIESELKTIDGLLAAEKEDRNKEIQNLEEQVKEKNNEKEIQNKKIINYNNLIKLEESREKDLEKYQKDLEKTENDLTKNKDLLNICKTFIGLKVKLQKAEFGKYLDKLDISLEKVVKSTGELQEDFSISYDGKEFNQLSNSGRIRAGLEIVNMFTQLKQVCLPTIIDNAESITNYNTTKGCQVIEMRVKKDAELSIVDNNQVSEFDNTESEDNPIAKLA